MIHGLKSAIGGLSLTITTEVHAGESVTAYVTANDEWVAEAYLETDYSKIHTERFQKQL